MPSSARLVSLAVLGVTLGATTLVAGCDIAFNTLQDGLVAADVVTQVRITGSSGDLTVVRDDAVKGVDIRRRAHYRTTEPQQSMRIESGAAVLDTDCGPQCTASYEVHLPHRAEGVRVSGVISSGDITLHEVSDVDVRVSSGDITITDATGTVRVESTSGDMNLTNVSGNLTATATSGSIEGRDLRGPATRIEAQSGDVRLTLPGTGDVTVSVGSGDLTVHVPDRTVLVSASAGTGERSVEVENGPAGSHKLDLRTGSGDITVNPS